MKKVWHSLLLLPLVLGQTANVSATVEMDYSNPPPSSNSLFSDVYSENPNYQAIKYLKDGNVVKGYTDGSFRPDNAVTRAEFIKMVIAALGANARGKNCFSDVKSEWFASVVCQAKSMKLISGYADGSFHPNQNVTFTESAKILVNAFKVSKGASDPDVWYKEFVDALSNKKAVPLSINFLDKEVTRADVAEMIWRLKSNTTSLVSRSFAELNGQIDMLTGLSCSDLQQRLAQNTSYYSPIYYEKGADMQQANQPQAAPTTGSSSGAGAGAPTYSTTNVQVAGVDEGDIVKNDSKYIYIAKNSSVRIVDAYPAESMKELVKIQLGTDQEPFYTTEMYVDGDRLVVVGNFYRYIVYDAPQMSGSKIMAPPIYNNNRIKVYVFDMTDRTAPTLWRSFEFDGDGVVSSRKVNNTLYLVMNRYLNYTPLYQNGTNPTNYSSDTVMPTMNDSKNNALQEKVARCEDVNVLPRDQGNTLLIAAALPLTDWQKNVARTVVTARADQIYASTDNLYVSTTDWKGLFWRNWFDQQNTAVYRFALSADKIEYKSKGSVPGRIIDQFSMDESDNTFRIATTKNTFVRDTQRPVNQLFVMDMNLNILGQVNDLAPGETIYSSRFLGNRAYIVTFRQIDPLFIVDLSNPKAPKVAGQLKIPGYSTYLHPYDQNHLIGFGNETDESSGMTKGLKLSLFDVTDVNQPKQMFTQTIGDQGTSSDLLWDHKALLFDKDKKLLAFPITLVEQKTSMCSTYTYSTCPTTCQKICVPSKCTTDSTGVRICTTDCDGADSCKGYDYGYGSTTFIGAYVYNLDLQTGFTLKGKVSHYTADEMAKWMDPSGTYYPDYLKYIQRVLYIGENLYSVSQSMVKANGLNDLAEKKNITLGGE